MTDRELLIALRQEVKAGNVREFTDGKYVGFCYTEQCQYNKAWNDINIQARGIVFFGDQVVARPFKKFFNLEEVNVSFGPDDIESITNKEDGSLIIAFHHDHRWHYLTKGSFESDQARLAERLMRLTERLMCDSWCRGQNGMVSGYTYLFELVGPSNRIVSRQYDSDQMILLGMIHTKTGEEVSSVELADHARFCRVDRPDESNCIWSNGAYNQIKNEKNPNFEGVVIRLKDGRRFKVKSEMYLNLHRLVTGAFTPRRAFELWLDAREGKQFDAAIPDEFYAEIRAKIADVETTYNTTLHSVYSYIQKVQNIVKDSNLDIKLTRKFIAVNFPELISHIDAGLGKKDFARHVMEVFCKEYTGFPLKSIDDARKSGYNGKDGG